MTFSDIELIWLVLRFLDRTRRAERKRSAEWDHVALLRDDFLSQSDYQKLEGYCRCAPPCSKSLHWDCPMSRSRGRPLVGAGLQVLLSLKASRAAIAFREARARAAFGHSSSRSR